MKLFIKMDYLFFIIFFFNYYFFIISIHLITIIYFFFVRCIIKYHISKYLQCMLLLYLYNYKLKYIQILLLFYRTCEFIKNFFCFLSLKIFPSVLSPPLSYLQIFPNGIYQMLLIWVLCLTEANHIIFTC